MNALKTIQKYSLYLLIAVYPVFVLSLASASYILPKEILLTLFLGISIVFWLSASVVQGSLKFNLGNFDLAILFIVTSYILSAIFRTPNKMEAFFYPGVVTFVTASAILYFAIRQVDKFKDGALYSLLISGLLLALSSIFSQLGLFGKIPQLPEFVKTINYSPLGGNVPTIIYLVTMLSISIYFILKKKDLPQKAFNAISGILIILGLVLLIKNALPGGSQSPKLPDFDTSWQVGVETLKVSPILGIGPGNYLTAFNRFRPVSYNSSDAWQIRFTTGSDYYLTVLTELGFLGVFAFAVLIFAVYKRFRQEPSVKMAPLIVLLILFAIFPSSPILMLPLFVLLAVVSKKGREITIIPDSSAKSAVILVGLPLIAAITAFYFFAVKSVMAEYTYSKALEALAGNDAKSTYNLMQSAISQNPQIDRYHASLAQVDMALASSLANKKDLTDGDRSTITQLVQQAINEGKATVTLNPQRSGNWEVLGQIYRSIMPFAQGADQFTVQTYTQAVALDSTNPNLRIALGGVYYALGSYDNAIDAFKLAVLAKPDLANAHYNLAIAYQAKKDYDNAITEMNNVLSLVPKDSQDYTLAKNTLNDLEKNKPASNEPNSGQSLTPPQTQQESNINPPIELPKEATPPATP